MSEIDKPDLENLFKGFSEVKTDAGAAARAIERTRQALVDAGHPACSRPQVRRRPRHMVAAATAITVVLGIAVVATVTPHSGSVALAQLQTQLDKVRTITFDLEHEVEGKPTITLRQLYRSDGYTREESAAGTYSVTRRTKDDLVRMSVDGERKTVRMVYHFSHEGPPDPVHYIRLVANSDAARPIEARQFTGQRCEGVLIRRPLGDDATQELRLWIHPESQLPVYCEFSARRDSSDKPFMIAKCRNFKYDVPLDDSLFSLTPPADYDVTTIGTPPERRTKPHKQKELVITLGEGIGPIRFGMPKEDVSQLFGKPEEVDVWTSGLGETWRYNSQGIFLGFRSDGPKGLYSVRCDSATSAQKAFRGRTLEGVKIGSSEEDVRRAYGPPDYEKVTDGDGNVVYKRKGLQLTLTDHRVLRFTVRKPRK